MQLEKFRVSNYRNANDSGWIHVSDTTVLVGRNESGKTNLLLALRALRPHGTVEPVSVSRDFPADRLRSEYSDALEVVRTVWTLSDQDRDTLGEIFPPARTATHVEVARGYKPELKVEFQGLGEAKIPLERAKQLITRISDSTEELGHAPGSAWGEAVENLGFAVCAASPDPRSWAAGVTQALSDLQGPLHAENLSLDEEARTALEQLGDLVADASHGPEYENAARQWVLGELPSFLYLDEYPEIEGHQDLSDFARRRKEQRPAPGDEYFAMLLDISGIDPDGLEALLAADSETRRQTASRAGAVLTRKMRELWSDRPLKIRFNLDGGRFDTLVADPTSACDVEVNLNDRSRGFQWFFSFYVFLAAGAKAGSTKGAILLLDEPGLHLHAIGQRDLLRHLASLDNTVVLATQSPFMVPADRIDCVRTVNIAEETGCTVSNTPSGDERTLFPIVHALGNEISKSLFGDELRLVVPELTDFWYLRAVSGLIANENLPGLPPGIEVLPAGGSARLPYLVALLAAHRSRALVLLSDDPAADALPGRDDASRFIEADCAVFVAEALGERSGGADLEDLLDPHVYGRFVRFSHRAELGDRELEIDEDEPRIVKRYEEAFQRAGIAFHRARPARFLLRGMPQNPDALLPQESRQRFARLFAAIRARCETLGG